MNLYDVLIICMNNADAADVRANVYNHVVLGAKREIAVNIVAFNPIRNILVTNLTMAEVNKLQRMYPINFGGYMVAREPKG